jgi:aspartyl-tRNA(Asn)/glutamyl-tRNA(Gln) amidotransferase subunit A
MLGTYSLSAGYYKKFYIKALKVKSKISEELKKQFSDIDAIISPVSPTLPFKIGEKINDPLKMYLADIFTVAANISGIPGLAIPSNISSGGLPMGFQILADKYKDEMLFDIGKKFEIFNNSKIIKPKLI